MQGKRGKQGIQGFKGTNGTQGIRKRRGPTGDRGESNVFIKVTNTDIYERICAIEEKLDKYIEHNEVCLTQINSTIALNKEERKTEIEKVKGSVGVLKATTTILVTAIIAISIYVFQKIL